MFPDLARDDVFRLETGRLWLRWPQAADAERIVALAGDKAVAEMTGQIPYPYRKSDADEFILRTRRANSDGEQLGLMLAFKNKPADIIGAIGVRPARGGLTLGYWLGRPYWGHGIVTEAAEALIELVFTVTSVTAVGATARVVNPASRRVIEKCGFAYVGTGLEELPARGGPLPCDRFRLDRKAWVGRQDRRVPARVRGEARVCA